jgi:hypothetical protein
MKKLLGVALFSAIGLVLTGCGNTPPSIDGFTLSAPTTGADGNLDIGGTLTVSDADKDLVVRAEVSASGPAVVPTQSLTLSPAVSSGSYQLAFRLLKGAPAGEYTFSVVVFDEPGGQSAAKTAKVTIP